MLLLSIALSTCLLVNSMYSVLTGQTHRCWVASSNQNRGIVGIIQLTPCPPADKTNEIKFKISFVKFNELNQLNREGVGKFRTDLPKLLKQKRKSQIKVFKATVCDILN